MSRRGDQELEAAGGRRAVAPNGKLVESVWEFPRPPRVERVDWRVRVVHRSVTVADAPHAIRVLETSQAPAYYVAAEFVASDRLEHSTQRSHCEWKGVAEYASVVVDGTVVGDAAWTYREPTPAFEQVRDHWAFYCQRVDECWIDDERVNANGGDFYGGWITGQVTGPFKGGAGTLGW